MNKRIAKDLEYKSFGSLFVLEENKYFKGVLCDCWCECGKFIKVNKDELVSGNKTSCGSEEHDIKLRPKVKKHTYINNKIKTRYKLLLHNRKKGIYKIDLTLQEYTDLANSNNECHYCSRTIDWLGKSSAYFLDRKDNKEGYSVENCVVCCTRCNMSKGGRFTYEEWCELGKIIKSWKDN